MQVAYCPWCGAEIKVLSYFKTGEVEWDVCSTPRCKGVFISIITDPNGFVIHPKHKQGSYIYRRPNKNMEEK